MLSPVLTLVIMIVALGAAAAVWLVLDGRALTALQGRYGTEYYRLVDVHRGDHRRAAKVLRTREERVSSYKLRALSNVEHEKFIESWTRVQADFVDQPIGAVHMADALVTELMTARGYPMRDFEHRAEDLSVAHAKVVDTYRYARSIALRAREGAATTEELRRTMVAYRALFADLLEVNEAEHPNIVA